MILIVFIVDIYREIVMKKEYCLELYVDFFIFFLL